MFPSNQPKAPRDADELHRTDDPQTSVDAAVSVATPVNLLEIQRRVLGILDAHGPMTQHALIRRYREQFGLTPESTIRTRCAELQSAGYVFDTGKREVLPSKRKAILFDVKRTHHQEEHHGAPQFS